MTQAKHLHGAGKTDAVSGSFEKKLDYMQRVLDGWIKNGEPDAQFWPKSLREFREWECPNDGLYAWKSPNVMSRQGRYSHLVQRYWKIQEKAKTFISKGGRSAEMKRLKDLVRVLAEQNTVLTWHIMELRDELARVDSKNPTLRELQFP